MMQKETVLWEDSPFYNRVLPADTSSNQQAKLRRCKSVSRIFRGEAGRLLPFSQKNAGPKRTRTSDLRLNRKSEMPAVHRLVLGM